MESPLTPSKAGGTPNPLAGGPYEALGAGIADLVDKMDAGKVSAKALAQQQANLIDHHQALSAISAKEAATVATLQRKIKDLTASVTASGVVTTAQSTEYAALNSALLEHKALLADHTAGTEALGAALGLVISKQEELTAQTEGILAKNYKAAGDAASKAAGPIGDVAKSLASWGLKFAPTLSKALTGASAALSPWIGGLIAGMSAVNMAMRIASRETQTFANVYGASLGMAMGAQVRFKTGVDFMGWATLDMAKIQKVGGAAMRAGAFDAYAANMLQARSGKDLVTASGEIANELGGAASLMTKAGRAFGLSEEQAGALLGEFASTMGAFNSSLPGADVAVGKILNRFGMMNKITGQPINNLFNMINGFSESTLPMGVKFGDLTAQTSLTMEAMNAYGNTVGKNGNQFWTSSANVEKLTKALFAYGASLTPMQTFGYNLAAGMSKAKDPIAGVLDSIAKNPFQRMGDQIRAFNKMGLGTDKTVLAMMQSGLPEKYATTVRELMKDPTAKAALMFATTTTGAGAEAKIKEKMAGLSPDTQGKIESISNAMAFMEDPLDQIARYTGQSAELLGQIAGLSASKAHELVYPTSAAKDSLTKQRPYGRRR